MPPGQGAERARRQPDKTLAMASGLAASRTTSPARPICEHAGAPRHGDGAADRRARGRDRRRRRSGRRRRAEVRTIPPEDAIAQSLAALAWLRSKGAEQILFKYLLDLRSTERGNIGPVSELPRALGADFTIACPALPENGRPSTSATRSSASSCCPTPTCVHPLTDDRQQPGAVLQRQARRRSACRLSRGRARPGGDPRCAERRAAYQAGDRRCAERSPPAGAGAAAADSALITGGRARRGLP